MNREIKFRIWDTVLKTMMPDFDNWIDFHGNYWTTPDERWDTKNTEIVRGHNYILMQFTGLTDKNGKEIYEGDILDGRNKIKKTVEWDSNRCAFVIIEHFKPPVKISFVQMYDKFKSLFISGGILTNLEVIGNIYE